MERLLQRIRFAPGGGKKRLRRMDLWVWVGSLGCFLLDGAEASERSNQMQQCRYEVRVDASAAKPLFKLMFSMILCVGSAVCVRAQDAQANETDAPWTATTQTSLDHANPSRTLESHSKSDNRSVDKQRVEVLGSDGRYQPYYDTETETIQVNG